MKARVMLIVIAAAAALAASSCTRIVNGAFKLGPMEYRVELERDVMVPMRDGTQLATDLYHPVGSAPGPVVMVRTPYGKGHEEITGYLLYYVSRMLAGHGYTVVVQDTRGRYGSEGEFYPLVAEPADGRDALTWAATQPWSDGKVGTWGGSYFGFTQWLPVIPIFLIVFWLISLDDRTTKGGSGYIQLAIADLQVVSYIVGEVWNWLYLVINFVFNTAMSLASIVTGK